MTRQSIFNRVATHLLTQNKKAIVDSECKYRTEDDLKCAVGCLISDKDYSPNMEGATIYGLYQLGYLPKPLIMHVGFLRDLQAIHDSEEVQIWPIVLHQFAVQYNLKKPKILKDANRVKS